MKRTYVFGHWGLTLLLAPFTSHAIQYVCLPNPNQLSDLLEVYPIFLLFSIAFSIPTLLVYFICFYLLLKNDINATISKFVLIVISVLGVYITQTIIKGSMSQDIIIAYSVTSIIVGLSLRISEYKIGRHNNPIST